MNRPRLSIAALGLSAIGFAGIVTYEGYSDQAIIPVKGDVPTIGFGTTQGVKMGDTTTPQKAIVRSLADIQKFEGALRQCVKVPLSQNEYDAYVQLAYNIGPGAFCGSSLVKKLNDQQYTEACAEILKWDKFQGKPLRGLTLRRQEEYRMCTGDTA